MSGQKKLRRWTVVYLDTERGKYFTISGPIHSARRAKNLARLRLEDSPATTRNLVIIRPDGSRLPYTPKPVAVKTTAI